MLSFKEMMSDGSMRVRGDIRWPSDYWQSNYFRHRVARLANFVAKVEFELTEIFLLETSTKEALRPSTQHHEHAVQFFSEYAPTNGLTRRVGGTHFLFPHFVENHKSNENSSLHPCIPFTNTERRKCRRVTVLYVQASLQTRIDPFFSKYRLEITSHYCHLQVISNTVITTNEQTLQNEIESYAPFPRLTVLMQFSLIRQITVLTISTIATSLFAAKIPGISHRRDFLPKNLATPRQHHKMTHFTQSHVHVSQH